MIREEHIRIPFRYAAGQAGSRFLVSLRDDAVLLGSCCEACGGVNCPPKASCPTCHDAEIRYVEVGPQGELVSWTSANSSANRKAFGLVRLDGADTALLHRLIGPAGSWRIGMRVKAKFAAQRRGSVLDIDGFVAAEDKHGD